MFSFVLSALNLLLCHLFLVQDAQSAINDLNGKNNDVVFWFFLFKNVLSL